MGRELIRVPADWEHPRQRCAHEPWAGGCSEAKANGGMCFQPMHMSRDFDTAARKWTDGVMQWDAGTHPDLVTNITTKEKHPYFWMWEGNPPDIKYYRPTWTSEPTHYQIYETVSEGTPVTPHFATQDELIDYLVEHGDFWDQQRARDGSRNDAGWSHENAETFVKGRGWAPSLVMEVSATGARIHEPRDGDL